MSTTIYIQRNRSRHAVPFQNTACPRRKYSVDNAHSKTFGATFQQLAKVALLSSILVERFAALRHVRAWLVHRSTPQLLHCLASIAQEATALLQDVGTLVERFAIEHGLSAQDIDRESRRLLECSGQPIPDTTLSFSSVTAGANPSLN